MADQKPSNDPSQNDEKSMFEEDDGLWHFRVPYEPLSTKGRPAAKSQWSTGRACPRCAGQLMFFEYIKEKDIVRLECKKCHSKWYENDLDPQNRNPLDEKDELTLPFDNVLFRDIPADRILYYANRVDRAQQIAERKAQEGGEEGG